MVIKQQCFNALCDAMKDVFLSTLDDASKEKLNLVNSRMCDDVAAYLEKYEYVLREHWELEDENGEIVEFTGGLPLISTLRAAAVAYEQSN